MVHATRALRPALARTLRRAVAIVFVERRRGRRVDAREGLGRRRSRRLRGWRSRVVTFTVRIGVGGDVVEPGVVARKLPRGDAPRTRRGPIPSAARPSPLDPRFKNGTDGTEPAVVGRADAGFGRADAGVCRADADVVRDASSSGHWVVNASLRALGLGGNRAGDAGAAALSPPSNHA